MFHYKLIITYDGTDFGGWQKQKERSDSIVHVMQHAYRRVFNRGVSLLGASRTDAGVHAIGQVALAKTDLDIAPFRLIYAWNNALPQAIRIQEIEKVDASFHPYRADTVKTYWYHFFVQEPLPFLVRYGWVVKKVELEKLKAALQVCVGTHDFTSFCTRLETENRVRAITDIQVSYVDAMDCYRIIVCGNGFLRHMIRRIVGAAITVATKTNLSVLSMEELLRAKNANNSFPTAPACGLVLYNIHYVTDIDQQERADIHDT